MKILFISPYIYNKDWPEFCKNKTGFGIMVWNIYRKINEHNDSFLISNVFTNGREKGVLKHTKADVILKSSIGDWVKGFVKAFKLKTSIKGFVHVWFYYVNQGYVRKTIKKTNPDVIHIHGLDNSTRLYIDICKKLDKKYVVTLHGLIGLDSSVNASKDEKEYEKTFLVEAFNDNRPVTVISSGMKERIEQNYIGQNSNNIKVICNGCEMVTETYSRQAISRLEDVKNNGTKLCCCIGNITDNKNQIEAIKIIEMVDKTKLLIFGRECDGGKCRQYVKDNHLEDKVVFMGFVDDMSTYMQYIDFNIFVSKNDGFGLSIIECMRYGIPSIMYDDLDSAQDLYREDIVVLVERNSIEKTVEELRKALDKEWNKILIKEFAKEFSLDKMAGKYIDYYRNEVLLRK